MIFLSETKNITLSILYKCFLFHIYLLNSALVITAKASGMVFLYYFDVELCNLYAGTIQVKKNCVIPDIVISARTVFLWVVLCCLF